MLKKVHHINLLVNDLASAVRNSQLAFEIDPDGVPAKYLAQHGLGRRAGLDGWQVRDLDPTVFNAAILQLTQDNGG